MLLRYKAFQSSLVRGSSYNSVYSFSRGLYAVHHSSEKKGTEVGQHRMQNIALNIIQKRGEYCMQ